MKNDLTCISEMTEAEKQILFAHLDTIEAPVIAIIGANYAYGVEFIDRYPKSTIFVVEPVPECIEESRQMINNNPRVHLLQYALSDYDGQASFHTFGGWYNVCSSLRVPTMNAHREGVPGPGAGYDITVEVRKIETLAAQAKFPARADFIVMDVQGCEQDVIHGGMEFFAASSMAFVEVSYVDMYEGNWLYDGVRDLMGTLGYRPNRDVGDERTKRQWSNVLFLKGQ